MYHASSYEHPGMLQFTSPVNGNFIDIIRAVNSMFWWSNASLGGI